MPNKAVGQKYVCRKRPTVLLPYFEDETFASCGRNRDIRGNPSLGSRSLIAPAKGCYAQSALLADAHFSKYFIHDVEYSPNCHPVLLYTRLLDKEYES